VHCLMSTGMTNLINASSKELKTNCKKSKTRESMVFKHQPISSQVLNKSQSTHHIIYLQYHCHNAQLTVRGHTSLEGNYC